MDLPGMVDIPPTKRLRWALRIMASHESLHFVGEGVVAMLRRQIKAPKHQLACPIGGLLAAIRSIDQSGPKGLDFKSLTVATIVALRAQTLWRSGDIARMSFGLWCWKGQFFVKCLQKGCRARWASIGGHALSLLLEYLWRVRNAPAKFVFRWANYPRLCLGRDRISNLVSSFMVAHGLPQGVWKAHSLRNGAATHLLQAGVPLPVVQSRGGWADEKTLIKHYALLSNTIDWEAFLFASSSSSSHVSPSSHVPSFHLGTFHSGHAARNEVSAAATAGSDAGCGVAYAVTRPTVVASPGFGLVVLDLVVEGADRQDLMAVATRRKWIRAALLLQLCLRALVLVQSKIWPRAAAAAANCRSCPQPLLLLQQVWNCGHSLVPLCGLCLCPAPSHSGFVSACDARFALRWAWCCPWGLVVP